MSAENPTLREQLAVLKADVRGLTGYVYNDLTHRLERIETAVYLLVVGVAGTLLAVLLEVLTR
jgi:hypothetical protein